MKEDGSPVMAVNPYRQKMVNVEPLFRLERYFDCYENLYKYMDDAIKDLVYGLSKFDDDDRVVLECTIAYLFPIRDMFMQISKCEISIPVKKGREV